MTQKPKRPRDANQLAKSIVDIATGQAEEVKPKAKGQQLGGKKGGASRAKSLTSAERSEIARIAAAARWKKSR